MMRLAKLLHHVITLTEPSELGATKLAKILWFADVECYREMGHTLSQSDFYRKRDQGPLHHDFYTALDELKAEGAIAERSTLTGVGPRKEFIWLKQPDLSEFTGEEIAIVDRVVRVIISLSAKGASDRSHDALWEAAYDRELIPVSAAAVVAGDVSDEVMEWAEGVFDVVRASGGGIQDH